MDKKITENNLAKNDVLYRSLKILREGPLPSSHNEHGDFCPYCAISLAKAQLDEEFGQGISYVEVIYQLAFGFSALKSDKPLIDAREAIGKIDEPYTLINSIEALERALI